MKTLSFCILACLILVGISSGRIINVPSHEPTIQAGINAAVPGDTVLVADGTYTGDGNRDIDFGGKGVFLKSENGPDFTIIDCQGDSLDPHRGFNFHSGEDSTAVVDGFTVRGGYALNDGPDGRSAGGGIKCDFSSSPKIMNNTISGNRTHRNGFGGGISCDSYSNPTISNNTISGNTARHVGHGGGISCLDNSSPTISNNTISGNRAIGGWAFSFGGGIYCKASSPVITNNTISGNSAFLCGGGIHCYNSSPIITNTIFWFNIENEVIVNETSSPVITYCNIRGGWEGEGNIDSNPLFLDPDNGNYNVCSQSRCIDAGDPYVTDPDGTRSDIGVFYTEHQECLLGNVWHVSTTGNDFTGDGSPENPFRTIQHAIDVSSYRDTVIVQNGNYVENIHIYSKNIVLASNYMYSSDTLDIQNTIIDGDLGPTAVKIEFCDILTAITGFTIRNGSPGGIDCSYSSPTISNNIISGNSARYHGGGVSCYESSPTISYNTISGNSAVFSGGGIGCSWNSNPTISRNIISGNWAGSGGGISCLGSSNATINNNTISENSADSGSGIYCSHSNPTISNTVIAFSYHGEAVYCVGSSNPVLTCCDVYGNEGGDWVGCIADQMGTNGNFSADPFFCDTVNGDYHLSVSSPCAPGNNSCGVLIGALDVGCSIYVCGDVDGDGELTWDDLTFLNEFYFNYSNQPILPMAAGDLNLNGRIDIGDLIWLAEYLNGYAVPPCYHRAYQRDATYRAND